jgi:hypothetical protein
LKLKKWCQRKKAMTCFLQIITVFFDEVKSPHLGHEFLKIFKYLYFLFLKTCLAQAKSGPKGMGA